MAVLLPLIPLTECGVFSATPMQNRTRIQQLVGTCNTFVTLKQNVIDRYVFKRADIMMKFDKLHAAVNTSETAALAVFDSAQKSYLKRIEAQIESCEISSRQLAVAEVGKLRMFKDVNIPTTNAGEFLCDVQVTNEVLEELVLMCSWVYVCTSERNLSWASEELALQANVAQTELYKNVSFMIVFVHKHPRMINLVAPDG